MRCNGTKKATNDSCGSPLYRCKSCGHEGCNQGAKDVCSNQAFAVTRCLSCNKLATHRLITEGEKTA